VTQFLSALATHTLALVLYPGLLTVIVFGGAVEVAWVRASQGGWTASDLLKVRLSPVLVTVALLSTLAAVQLAAPFNPVPSEERNLIIVAIALSFTAWVELALTLELVPAPGLLLVIQFCWLIAVLGPAVEPQSLRPQVLGNVLVPALLPLKVASGFLYLLCLPALLRLWPVPAPGDRRARGRFDVSRGLCWLPYCGLFTTLFVTPSADDLLGILRFFGISLGVAALMIVTGVVMRLRGAAVVRGLYYRAVAPYAAMVLGLVVVTALLLR
jgi:hypothetical protein